MKKMNKKKKSAKMNPIHKMPFGEVMRRIVRVEPEEKRKKEK